MPAPFEPTAGGMGIQRRPTNGHARTRPAEGRRPSTFAGRAPTAAAMGQVLCSHFCRYGRWPFGPSARTSTTRCASPSARPICTAACATVLPSHEPPPERMPTCRLFHHGLRTAEACEFSHVYLGAGTKLCAAFSRNGYCADGASCANRHEMVCEVYVRDGSCALGERCRLSRRLRAEDRASVLGGSSQL